MPKIALITGGAVRIGKAIALKLAACGFSVAIQYGRSKEAAEELAAAISQAGGRAARAVQASLGDLSQVEALIPAIDQGRWGL